MYISGIEIQNYRCFNKIKIDFNQGINVIIGENNAGKTTLIRAIGFVFNRLNRPTIDIFDFYQGITDFSVPPEIIISITLKSSGKDTESDKALVATWLTKLESPWEALLTFKYFLSEEDAADFKEELGDSPQKEKFWNLVEKYLPKYISHIYGGNPASQIKAEPDSLRKFDFQFLDAIRDVDRQMISGSNPLLKTMLQQVLDFKATKKQINESQIEFSKLSKDVLEHLLGRLDKDQLFNLVEDTGAKDGGEPDLSGRISENDLISSLRLFIRRGGFELPAEYNGLGYNNLIYISLLLASLDFQASVEKRGPNAVLFPMLLIEEPEAHLHPALQYKLLKYVKKRIRMAKDSRQIFITTHSTHITAASGLDPIICMSLSEDSEIKVAYPGRVFSDEKEGGKSKRYVERYLDATKSNMLFSKAIIFVEGIAEQLLFPCLADCLKSSLEEHHIALIGVGGLTFKHFLPIFGAGAPDEKKKSTLNRKVACVIDADPARKLKTKGRRKGCFPYELNMDKDRYEYYPISGAVVNLRTQCEACDNVKVFSGIKTLEYDLAVCNSCNELLLTPELPNIEDLKSFTTDSTKPTDVLKELLDEDTAKCLEDLEKLTDKIAAEFASYYLKCIEDMKGEHALILQNQLRDNLEKKDEDQLEFSVPKSIKDAIAWVCPVETGGEDATK
jgi:putative ATP-dependent endonuclease of the OLD family